MLFFDLHETVVRLEEAPNRKNQLTPGRTPSLLRNLRTFGKALSIYGGGERGPVTFPAFKAGDAFLRGTGGGFDFHTPPPNG